MSCLGTDRHILFVLVLTGGPGGVSGVGRSMDASTVLCARRTGGCEDGGGPGSPGAAPAALLSSAAAACWRGCGCWWVC